MARKPRLEVEGGLSHLITRGVDRQDIFYSPEDQKKFIALLAVQKGEATYLVVNDIIQRYGKAIEHKS
jgi:hypothetical protein